MIEHFTNNVHANLYLMAAKKLGLEFEVLDAWAGYARIFKRDIELYVLRASLSCNTHVASRVANEKYLTGNLLAKEGFPVPKQHLYDFVDQYLDDSTIELEFTNSGLEFPVVVKPMSGYGGAGVHMGITSTESLVAAVKDVIRLGNERVVVEEFINGKNYRVLVFRNEVIDILERRPPEVVGDGVSTIMELIMDENVRRANSGKYPLVHDARVSDYLAQNGRYLDDIPAAGDEVTLMQVSNFSLGGTVKRISCKDVHADTLDLFLEVTAYSNLDLCGIDFISMDLTKSWKDIECGFNELNHSPGMMIQYWADYEQGFSVPEEILKRYFNL